MGKKKWYLHTKMKPDVVFLYDLAIYCLDCFKKAEMNRKAVLKMFEMKRGDFISKNSSKQQHSLGKNKVYPPNLMYRSSSF